MEQILSTDTRLGLAQNLSATAVPSAVPNPVLLPITSTTQSTTGLEWILPGIVVVSLLIVASLIFVILSSRWQNAPPK